MKIYNLNQLVSIQVKDRYLTKHLFIYYREVLLYDRIFFWKKIKKKLKDVYFNDCSIFSNKSDEKWFITKEELELIDNGKYNIDINDPNVIYRSACIKITFSNVDEVFVKYFKNDAEMYTYFNDKIKPSLNNNTIILR